MNHSKKVMYLFSLAAFLACAGAPAYGQDSDAAELKEEIKSLRADLAVLTSTMLKNQIAIDSQFKKVLAELATVKKGQAPAKRTRKPDLTVYDVKIGDSPYKGPKDAPITIVEFSEFQCPFCTREGPKLEQVLKDYPNDVKVVFKHYPLKFHKDAKPAAAAAIFAQKQKGNDAFWQMHDKIFGGGTKKLAVSNLRGYAEEMGLDLAAFDALMADAASIDSLVATDMAEAKKCKVTGTPTVMINGLKLSPRTAAGYKARIEQLLKELKKT